MATLDEDLWEEVVSLRALVAEAQQKAAYYQKIAEETGRKRLREIDQLTALIERHRETERALRESELKFRNLFDFSPHAVAVVDFQRGEFLEVNDTFCRLTRCSRGELLGATLEKSPLCSAGELKAFMLQVKGQGPADGVKMNMRLKDGCVLHLLVFSRLVHLGERAWVVLTLVDLTRQQQLESKLMDIQRMEALGTLAGGIAHDFNNLLMAIQGNVTLALLGIGPSSPQFKTLQRVDNLVKSGAKLTGRLLGFARKGSYEVKALDLNQLIGNTADAFGGARKDIRIRKEFSGDLASVELDKGQMEQVLLNLYINAADAMPEGGDLFLRTSNVTHEAMQGSAFDPKPGDYVMIEVRDGGTGIDPAIQPRIFEPFFTTKENGRGTGLGLASVFGIVKAHGGYIDFESEVGRGTTFRIFLPASRKDCGKAKSRRKETIRRGRGTILMVDDEERVLSVSVDLVKSLGYRVLQARGGREALELYKESRNEVDLVIMDMVMPGMNGRQTCENMKQINPRQKILLCSGYTPDSMVKEMLENGCDGFIQKPYDLVELSGKIEEILKAADGPSR